MNTTSTGICPGSYPGGPKRFDAESLLPMEFAQSLRGLRNVEDLRAAARTSYRSRTRRIRLLVGVFVALAAALAVGFGVAASRANPLAQTGQSVQAGRGVERILVRERERILKELWKMEAQETRGVR